MARFVVSFVLSLGSPTVVRFVPPFHRCISQVTVTLTDGRKFLATVKGADELSDLAVLKIDRDVGTDQTPLPAAKLGNSQDLQAIMLLLLFSFSFFFAAFLRMHLCYYYVL